MLSSIFFSLNSHVVFFTKQLAAVLLDCWVFCFICVFLGISFLVEYLFAVPSKLRHLPKVSQYATIWSYACREPVDSRVWRLILPFTKCRKGVVLVYMLGKWGVHLMQMYVLCQMIMH
jgi:hypothetical protein